MIGSVYRNQIPQAGFLELCLPLMYKFYPFENEILETLKQNSFIEDIVQASNRNSLMGADRHMRIKFLYTAGIITMVRHILSSRSKVWRSATSFGFAHASGRVKQQ